MLVEKEELQDLKEEMADYTEDLKLLETVVKQSGTKQLKVRIELHKAVILRMLITRMYFHNVGQQRCCTVI